MAGKKKKTLANKLARMSDEERARYLQHKAEMEEEARRRKEQLISTFMKKKIKKEDAFTRLNMAKINQNWHQIMRKIKVKEMKDEVEHLKQLIERLVETKNRRIENLVIELEEAEEQYMHNFNSHSTHLDNIIENQHHHIDQLQSKYQKELEDILNQAATETIEIETQADQEMCYLKTITFGQESRAAKVLKDNWEDYTRRLYEVEYNNNVVLKNLRKTRGETESALWKQILEVIRQYVQKTDVRRSHLQELRRIDAESAEEIRNNEEKMIKEEEFVKILTVNYEDLVKLKSDKVKSLEAEEAILKEKYLKIKKTLKTDMEKDERKLRFLTATASEVLRYLTQLAGSGKHLLSLSQTCQKYVTEREKVAKWLPIIVYPEDVQESGLTDDEKLFQKTLHIEDKEEIDKPKPRLKTSIPHKSTSPAPIEEIKIETKKVDSHSAASQTPDLKKNIMDECFESLEKLEGFWTICNKAQIDVMELKREKTYLEKENKQLAGMIKAVLEAAALSQSIPSSTTVSTRAPSRKRGSLSAPLHRIML